MPPRSQQPATRSAAPARTYPTKHTAADLLARATERAELQIAWAMNPDAGGADELVPPSAKRVRRNEPYKEVLDDWFGRSGIAGWER